MTAAIVYFDKVQTIICVASCYVGGTRSALSESATQKKLEMTVKTNTGGQILLLVQDDDEEKI